VLNRRRRILFVNRAWESLTGISATAARGLACVRRAPIPQDPWDVVVRALCCPPPEVLKGQPGRARRLVPAVPRTAEPSPTAARWWDVEFFPLHDEQGLLCVLGKITPLPLNRPILTPPLPEKLMALRQGRAQQYSLDKIASSVPMVQRVVDQVRLAGATNVPVLLVGEPGTGKHWIARTIHHQGKTREGTFVALDCARLPSSALSSLLFGERSLHERQGTYYFRELSSLSRDAQTWLRDRIREAGETAGPRLIASCRVDPGEEVRAGRLLEELYCSFSTLVIAVPPLRERRADLPALVQRLLERANMDNEHRITGLTREAWDLVRAYAWPGNLRELYAVLQRACRRTPGEQIDVSHLPASLRMAVRLDQTPTLVPDAPLPLLKLLEQAERRLILLALQKARGNQSRAAEILSILRPRLIRRMQKLGIGK
jgi:DNA-binding NtrC family response regulator